MRCLSASVVRRVNLLSTLCLANFRRPSSCAMAISILIITCDSLESDPADAVSSD